MSSVIVDAARTVYDPSRNIRPEFAHELAKQQQQNAQPNGQPQYEGPQPDSELAEQPPTGIDPDVAAALSNPKVRAALEAPLQQAAAAAASHDPRRLTNNIFRRRRPFSCGIDYPKVIRGGGFTGFSRRV